MRRPPRHTTSSKMWGHLVDAFHAPTTSIYGWVQGFIGVLIAVSVAIVLIDLALLEPDHPYSHFRTIDRALLYVFIVELVLRVATYRPPITLEMTGSRLWHIRHHFVGRLRFCLRPFQQIDILTVLAVVPALRGLRALRLLRLLRGAKIFRYSNPVSGILRSFQENALLYAMTFSWMLGVIAIAGVSIYLVESTGDHPQIESIPEGIWWALVTITTVGYGDLTPMTFLGKIIGGSVMIMGMFTLALFAGIVGSTLLRTMLTIRQDQFRMSGHIGHIVILGFDDGAHLLLDALTAEFINLQTEVLIFAKTERPDYLPPDFIWVNGDPTKESELEKIRLPYARAAIIVGSRVKNPQEADATNILVTFTVRAFMRKHAETDRRKQPLYVVTEILDAENVGHARAAGADEVIETTRLGFALMTHAVQVHGSGEIMSSVASAGAHSLYIGVSPLDKTTTFAELRTIVRAGRNITVLGVRDPETGLSDLSPSDGKIVTPQHAVVYLSATPILESVD